MFLLIRERFGYPIATVGVLLPVLHVIVRLLDDGARRSRVLINGLVALIGLPQSRFGITRRILVGSENAYVESFNGLLRDECLNEHWFVTRK